MKKRDLQIDRYRDEMWSRRFTEHTIKILRITRNTHTPLNVAIRTQTSNLNMPLIITQANDERFFLQACRGRRQTVTFI